MKKGTSLVLLDSFNSLHNNTCINCYPVKLGIYLQTRKLLTFLKPKWVTYVIRGRGQHSILPVLPNFTTGSV